MSFRVVGLAPEKFASLHKLDDDALAAQGAVRVRVKQRHAAPCRISLDDAEIGEAVILLGFLHQDSATAYRQQGPIFVREGVQQAVHLGEMPPALARRTLSLRGFDARGTMIEADLVDGKEANALIGRFFANSAIAYIHAHYARRGCFAALIERA